MPDKLAYTVEETLAAIGIGRTTLYKMIGEGKLRAVKMGGRTLILADSLRTLIDGAETWSSDAPTRRTPRT
jgi:excisionase family DNA binding protein